jgi:hypothetical protein
MSRIREQGLLAMAERLNDARVFLLDLSLSDKHTIEPREVDRLLAVVTAAHARVIDELDRLRETTP